MKQILILAIAILSITFCKAQTAEDSVKAVINQMFTAMKNADSKMLSACFADSAILQTISAGRNGTRVRTDSLAHFINGINKLPKDSVDERITFEMIKIDGLLASVWTPYQFYYAGTFRHCGVNSFQLVRINGLWKIQYLVDTRRRQGCL